MFVVFIYYTTKIISFKMSNDSVVASGNTVIVGLDFGGVLSRISKERVSKDRSADHIDTNINMPDAVDVLTDLLDPTVTTRSYKFKIISYCGYSRAVQTFEALKAYPDLFNEIYFVKDRDYKGSLCKYLGCHIMVDDRREILDNIRRMNPRIMTVLFGNKKGYPHKSVQNWNELFELIENYKFVSIDPDTSVDISGLIHDVCH